jgi:hypothetical protein
MRKRPKARRLAEQIGRYKVDNLVKENPEIARAYELYTVCRAQQMVTHDVMKGGKQLTRTEPYPVGYNVLPEEGGVLDQPQRLMVFFEEFMNGERRSFGT